MYDLLGDHTRTEHPLPAHPSLVSVFARLVDEFADGAHDGQHETHQQHHEDASHLLDVQRTGGAGLLLRVTRRLHVVLLPEEAVELADHLVLLQLQDRFGDHVAIQGAWRERGRRHWAEA